MFCGNFSGSDYPEFVLSIAGLILFNAVLYILLYHLSYSPGLITSVILYLPVSFYGFGFTDFHR
jgi:hypothetical protein